MAQRATSFGPKPSKFICFLFFGVCFCSFSFFCFVIQKKPCFPLRKGHCVYFLSVSLCSSLVFLGLPLFQFFFLSLSLIFVLFFLPSCHSFLFFLVPLFLFMSFLFCLLCFCFMKRTTSEKLMYKIFFINHFFGGVSCLLFSLKSFFLIFVFFADLKLCFCSTSLFWVLKNQIEKHRFLVKRGLQQNGFFMTLCFAKCEKLSFFWGHFLANFG